jgi:hypothetical protein
MITMEYILKLVGMRTGRLSNTAWNTMGKAIASSNMYRERKDLLRFEGQQPTLVDLPFYLPTESNS